MPFSLSAGKIVSSSRLFSAFLCSFGPFYTEMFLYSDVLSSERCFRFRMFIRKCFFVDTEMVKVLSWFSKKMATRNPETTGDQTAQGKE